MLIPRSITSHLEELGKYYPIITLTGPRQAGKTTLLKNLYPGYRYVSFEAPEVRIEFERDPNGFLSDHNEKVIFDEAQYVPELFSYLQLLVDENRDPGRFILSGSQNFLLLKSITQSLAGRAGIARLLPLTIAEKRDARLLSKNYTEEIYNGSYPEKTRLDEPSNLFYSNYLASYVQRDVSTLISATNLSTFQRFLQICAGYAGQIINYSKISLAVGVSVPTIQSWMSVLEQSYIIFRLQPFYRNIPRRLLKSPKLYFYDTGLACHLLRIGDLQALKNYHLFGSLFENLIVSDAFKSSYHNGKEPWFSFYRDKSGEEVDLIYDVANELILWEIKATQTFRPELTKTIHKVSKRIKEKTILRLIYGGDRKLTSEHVQVLPWDEVSW
ncbi:MAG: ATP-binding protein [Bacteroidota bacterium]